MQFELSKERQVRKKKVRTWTEAAKLALELYPKTPMGHKDIFNVIRAKGLKDVSGPASLACLNAMLHVHSRGPEAMFYRVDGCTSVFGLASNIPEGGIRMEVDEEDSGQEFDPGDSDHDSETSLPPTSRKKDRVLYVRLPPGQKSVLSSSAVNLPQEDSILHKADQLTVKPLAYKNEYYTRIRRMNGEKLEEAEKEKCNQAPAANLPVTSPAKVSQSHSQRAIKHALRQQQKRRRRNTAIAASGSAPPPIPRIIMKSLPPAPTGAGCVPEERWRCSLEKTSLRESTSHKPQTMRELLASIPGLSFKPRKRSNRKLSTAAQIAQTKKGCINIETPDSILVNTNLRALLNKHTFASLPSVYQYRLVQLLPQADRMIGSDYAVRLTGTALSNEFFARACQEWKKRLQEGEFTPENQMKLKGEAERDHSRLDPWKIHNFEPVWGHTSLTEFPDQAKPSPFLINTQLKSKSIKAPAKHMPSIKIKPVVRKSRLTRLSLRHLRELEQDALSNSDENRPCMDSPLYNEVQHMDVSTMAENTENLYGPPAKKLKVVEASSNSSESQESSEESLQAVIQHSPCPSPSASSVMSTPSPAQSIDEVEAAKDDTGAESSDIPISLSVTDVQTTAPSQSIVPPITIRSIPVHKSSGRNDGMTLERSYQICKAALESNNKREPQPPIETTSVEPQVGDTTSMVTSSVTSSDVSPLETSLIENIDSLSVDCNLEAPSSTNQLLLTTCLPSTVPTFSLNSVSSTINSAIATSNACTNDEVSFLIEEEIAEEDRMDVTEDNLNLPVLMAADSTSIEEPDMASESLPATEQEDFSVSQSSLDCAILSPSGQLADMPEDSALAGMLEVSPSESLLDDLPSDSRLEESPSATTPEASTVSMEEVSPSISTLEGSQWEHIAVLVPSQSSIDISISPLPLMEEDSPITSEMVEDMESSNSMNIVVPGCSSCVKDHLSDESCFNNGTISLEQTSCDNSISLTSNTEAAETNMVSSSLQIDMCCLPAECLDSDSSLQTSFNNSQVVDEDSTIILSMPASEEENLVSDDPTVAEESLPEKQILGEEDVNSKSLSIDNSDSSTDSLPSPTDQKQDLCFEIENKEVDNSDSPCVETQLLPTTDDTIQTSLSTDDTIQTSPSIDDPMETSPSTDDTIQTSPSAEDQTQFEICIDDKTESSHVIDNAQSVLVDDIQPSFSIDNSTQFSDLASDKMDISPLIDDIQPLPYDKSRLLPCSDEDLQSSASSEAQILLSIPETMQTCTDDKPKLSVDEVQSSSISNQTQSSTDSKNECDELSTFTGQPFSSIPYKHFDPPDRPLSAPLNFTPVSSSPEVNSVKRPSSCQSYYRRSKVSPIVYFDSPESDDGRSDCDKTDEMSPTLSGEGTVSLSSAFSNEESSSSIKTDHFGSSVNSNSETQPPPKDSSTTLSKPESGSQCPSIPRAASTPSFPQFPKPEQHRPLSNPVPDSSLSHPLIKLEFQNSQFSLPDSSVPHQAIKLEFQNSNHLPEGCTGGTGGILPSQAVSVVPASTQLPIASGGVMFPSMNGVATVVGTPAGDTPPRSLLQSSPIINGASSGMVESAGDGGSRGSGSGTPGRILKKKTPRKKYFLRKRDKRRK
ncbi:hypothetical protein JTE90_006582 [Oedothorax gibbosus]|uniref:Polycomb group protein ASXL3 n=1 Tax=Oedothorax gibbosus TaxID=931172 RepID=A0AAV6VKX9_9ARAC|nr:hypothetical protein JTE90_006582 [Oedothorax gibbosus]